MIQDGYIEFTTKAGEPGRIELAPPESGQFIAGYPGMVVDLLNQEAKSCRWISVPFDAAFTLLDKARLMIEQCGCPVVVHWPTTHLDETLGPDEVW